VDLRPVDLNLPIVRATLPVAEWTTFPNVARDRLAETDEAQPCEPEDCVAVLGYFGALLPEYELAQQAEASGDEERRAERWRAVFDGFRRARGAMPANGNSSNTSGSNPASRVILAG
jgi:hypothetical protein